MNTSTRNLRAAWVRLWLLRLYRARLDGCAADDTALFSSIRQGLRRLRVYKCADDREALQVKVAALLARTESRVRIASDPLFADFARVFSLNADELQVFAFVCMVHEDAVLGTAARDEKRYPSHRGGIGRLLQDALGLPQDRLRSCLRVRGALLSARLLSIYYGNYGGAIDCIEPGEGLAAIIAEETSDISVYLDRLFEPCGDSELGWSDYAHMNRDAERVRAYISAACQDHKGANILLHGAPGTGKSQFARVLAAQLGLTLYSVRTADIDGEPIEGRARLMAYDAAQKAFAANAQAMLLFDEIEDVFRRSGDSRTGAVSYKSWINRQLETSRVPCIWIGNRFSGMDDSQCRRFDMVIEMSSPPRRARRAMLAQQLRRWEIEPALMDVIAERDAFAPAHYQRAVRMLERMNVRDSERAGEVLCDSLNEILHVQGARPLARHTHKDRYDPSLIRTDQPVAPILDLLARRPSARLCLYGPPGTGKTALAAHIAECIERPLLKRRASELLGSYVGETERAIARMFREAERDDAVLCLDEADSFLRERQGAMQRWEITQVNELLVRLEEFEGIFVASTNLMESLDAAALRRFDFKLRFEWLDLAQRERLFIRYVERFGLRQAWDKGERQRQLASLDCLAPGDFTALRHRIEAQDDCSESDLLAWLRSEQALKPGRGSRRIGFVA
ncbi:ATP-binding protein [Dyella sp.]|uniref:AAA family ATPase n=1 Tax=Dyella sp. TaxID=1869338 RepID=UPI002ED2781F